MSRTDEVNELRELASSIASNLGDGTAEELVEFALGEGCDSWGISVEIDEHDRDLLVRFVEKELE